jgi:hypothetical protein
VDQYEINAIAIAVATSLETAIQPVVDGLDTLSNEVGDISRCMDEVAGDKMISICVDLESMSLSLSGIEAKLDGITTSTVKAAATLERIETLLEKMLLLDGIRHQHRTEPHLPPDVFRVPYQGDKSMELSASELALHHGYRYFVYLPEGEATPQSAGKLIRGLHQPEGFAFDAHRLYQSLKAKRP